MESTHILEFSIDVFTPETIPMSRLAEYMAQLAELYGSEPHIHFDTLRGGSAILSSIVQASAMPLVEKRLSLVHDAAAPEQFKKAFQHLNLMLKADKAIGEIRSAQGTIVLSFQGRHMQTPKIHRVRELGVLDGVVIRVGGKDNTIPVWLQEASGVIHKCETTSDMARDLAHQYLRSPIRVTGQGEWLRGENGEWKLEKFKISAWEVLEETELISSFAAARNADGNGWNSLEDPVGEHLKLRTSELNI